MGDAPYGNASPVGGSKSRTRIHGMTLDEAVNSAQRAMLDLIGLMTAYGLDFQTLPLLLQVPAPVEAAYAQWAYRMNDVAKILAYQEGVDESTTLSQVDRLRFTQEAFTFVMD